MTCVGSNCCDRAVDRRHGSVHRVARRREEAAERALEHRLEVVQARLEPTERRCRVERVDERLDVVEERLAPATVTPATALSNASRIAWAPSDAVWSGSLIALRSRASISSWSHETNVPSHCWNSVIGVAAELSRMQLRERLDHAQGRRRIDGRHDLDERVLDPAVEILHPGEQRRQLRRDLRAERGARGVEVVEVPVQRGHGRGRAGEAAACDRSSELAEARDDSGARSIERCGRQLRRERREIGSRSARARRRAGCRRASPSRSASSRDSSSRPRPTCSSKRRA